MGEWSTDFDNTEYSSVDMLMRTTLNQDSVWEDLGVTQQSNRVAVAQNLAAQGWNMVLQCLLSLLVEIALDCCSEMALHWEVVGCCMATVSVGNH